MSQAISGSFTSFFARLPADTLNKVLEITDSKSLSALAVAAGRAGRKMLWDGKVPLSQLGVLIHQGKIPVTFYATHQKLPVSKLPPIPQDQSLSFDERFEILRTARAHYFDEALDGLALCSDMTPEQKRQVIDYYINYSAISHTKFTRFLNEQNLLEAATPNQLARLVKLAAQDANARAPSTKLLELLIPHLNRAAGNSVKEALLVLSKNTDSLTAYRMLFPQVADRLSLSEIGEIISNLSRNPKAAADDFAALSHLFGTDAIHGALREIEPRPLEALTLNVVGAKNQVLKEAFTHAVEEFTPDDETRKGYYRQIKQ